MFITKITASQNPVSEPCSWEAWIPGNSLNSGSLPADYELRGVLLDDIRIGECLDVFRTHRNGVACDGHFKSTPVISIGGGGSLVETFNSIYRITAVNTKKEERI